MPAATPTTTTAGLLAALSCSVLWAISIHLYRPAIIRHGSAATNLFKCALAAALYGATLLVAGAPGLARVPTADVLLAALSGVLGLALGDTIYFQAMRRFGIQRTLLIYCTSPVFTAALGLYFFDERLSPLQIAGIGLTVAGIALVVRDRRAREGQGPMTLGGFLFALLAAVTQAVGILTQRPALAWLSTEELCLVRTGTATVLLAATGLWAPAPRRVGTLVADRAALGPLLAAAVLGTYVGLQLQAYGIAHAQAGVVGALTSLTPLFSLPIGWWTGRERVGRLAVLGTLVSVAGVVGLSLGR